MTLLAPATLPVSPSAPASALAGIDAVLFGPLGTGLAVIAVAWLGFEALSGRLSLRRGGQVILGCFILFGAPQLAKALMVTASDVGNGPIALPPPQALSSPPPLPPSPTPFDPYAGASVPNGNN